MKNQKIIFLAPKVEFKGLSIRFFLFLNQLRKILTLRKILGLRNISRYPSTGTLRPIQPSGNAVAGTAHAGRLLLREVIYRCLKGRKALQEYIITA